MTAAEKNLALAKVYQEYIDEISLKSWDQGISSPLLMNVPAEYCQMKRKILFVGQETHTWMEGIEEKHDVATLQQA